MSLFPGLQTFGLHLRIAFSSLMAHKLRTALAMLGVFLGALALTGVQTFSMAMSRQAEIETRKLGPNLMIAAAGRVEVRRPDSTVANAMATNFTAADAEALIEGTPSVVAGAPYVTVSPQVRAGGVSVACQLTATTPAYQQVRDFRVERGRFITDQDLQRRDKVCVLGVKIAKDLFGDPGSAIGQSVWFYTISCKVVGVMQPKGANIAGVDEDMEVFTPLTTFQRRFLGRDFISGVYLQLAEGADREAAKDAASRILRARHAILGGEADDFVVLTPKDKLKTQQRILDLVHFLGLIGSTISFVVGGMGILSIMILMVRMRRLEIGVRRAAGARRGDIVGQFLLESGLMSVTGGGLGVLFAVAALSVYYMTTGVSFFLSPTLVLVALAASAAMGLAAGAYPAWRASRLEIVEVLRDKE